MMINILNKILRFLLYFTALAIPFIDATQSSYLMITLLILFFIVRKEYPGTTFALKKNGIWLAFVVIVILYATIFSVSVELSMVGFIRFGNALFLMLIIQWVLVKKKEIFLYIQLFIISSTVVAGYGVFQYFFKGNNSYLLLDKVLHPDIEVRVTSIMQNPNNLAGFLVLVIPLVMAVFFYKEHWFHKLIAIVATAILVLCLVFTYSRTAYVGFVVSALMFIIFVEARLLLLTPFAVGGLLVWMPESLRSRLDSLINSSVGYLTDVESIKDTSAEYRTYIWNGAAKLFHDFKWFGVGLDNNVFKLVYGFYMDTGVLAVHAHSLFFEMILELGIFGFIILIFFIFKVALNSYQMTLTSQSKFNKLFTIGCIAGIVGLLIVGIAEHSWYYHKEFYSFFVLMGLLMAVYNNEYNNRSLNENN